MKGSILAINGFLDAFLQFCTLKLLLSSKLHVQQNKEMHKNIVRSPFEQKELRANET